MTIVIPGGPDAGEGRPNVELLPEDDDFALPAKRDSLTNPADFDPDYDAERVTEPGEIITGRPVDLPEDPRVTLTGKAEIARRPIVPAWARTRTDFETAAKHWADRTWYRTRFHAAYSPLYALKVLRWAPVGAARIIAAAWRWTFDAEQAPLRKSEARPGGNVDAYLRLVNERNNRVKRRLPIVGGGAAAVLGTGVAAYATLPSPALAGLGALTALLLARHGRPADKPLTSTAVVLQRYERLTAERVREALCSIGVSGLKDPKRISFPTEIHRDGPGQLARVNLPPGVEAVDVCEKRGKLSSALRLPVDQVWTTAGPDHAGQLDLWVGYQPASKMRPPKWSLAQDGARTSVFEPAEFGADQRQRPVSAPLFARNWLIGGVPGSGKSYFARALALAAALDPTVEFKIAEFKGTADFGDFEPLCSDYYCGVDDEALEGGARIIAWGLAEAERRGKRIKKFREQGRAPEGKVTPELAAEPGSGLHPVVILIDEAHELLVDPDVATAAERLIKRGRALGLIVILATQIPDAKSVPPIITRCVTMRACLAVQDHIANDMILGTGSYRRGVTATSYRPGLDAGWAMVTGLETPIAVRSQFPDEATGKKILKRAIQLRGGVIPGGDDEETPRLDVLIDVQRVWPAERAGMQWQHLVDLLTEFRPEVYGDLTKESLSALLRGLGVPSEAVKANGSTLQGCKRVAIGAALEQRELGRG
ncbi:FtsK/SpoIIIE domain-containing protein [Microbispora rosea]|uniref:FtsK/SpoIIIE domain-containing protein n=1 Tax=Microbispora rosea TaxID=58117 RepID=UPI00068D293F|nr:FtsK/SpoIIIE domain-containing protein [Microbispora rosea]